jgi:hypothetical protein
MLDIVATRRRADELLDVQQGQVVFQRRSFTISRQRDPPALLDE